MTLYCHLLGIHFPFLKLVLSGMGDVGGIPEDAYDDMITDENERRKLQGYNINKEMKINTTKMSRSVIFLHSENFINVPIRVVNTSF